MRANADAAALFQLGGTSRGTKPALVDCPLISGGSAMFGDKIGLVLFVWIVGAPLAGVIVSRMAERR
jgi:hypothetical protein